MACTVKKLAAVSGVSVRTLHFYDEVGLLKPAWVGANGYRYYEEEQLLKLQQILFYRELGFDLRRIKAILGRDDFDRIGALRSHRKVLEKGVARTRKLIATIDRTIEHLEGTRKMKSQEMFAGFDPDQQAKHEQYLIERYGPEMREGIAESKRRVKDWTRARWEKSGEAFNRICTDLVAVLQRKLGPDSPQAQDIIRRHFEWMKQFWTPNRESYAGHSQLIVGSELRKPYEAHHPELPEFVAAAIRRFAETQLA